MQRTKKKMTRNKERVYLASSKIMNVGQRERVDVIVIMRSIDRKFYIGP